MRLHKIAPKQDSNDFVSWAEPLLGDVLSSAYSEILTDQRTVGPIVRCHVLLWRSVLTHDERMEAFRDALLRLTHRVGISEAEIEAFNREVLAELMHVIAIRYQRSPRLVADTSLELARAACLMTTLRRPTRA